MIFERIFGAVRKTYDNLSLEIWYAEKKNEKKMLKYPLVFYSTRTPSDPTMRLTPGLFKNRPRVSLQKNNFDEISFL